MDPIDVPFNSEHFNYGSVPYIRVPPYFWEHAGHLLPADRAARPAQAEPIDPIADTSANPSHIDGSQYEAPTQDQTLADVLTYYGLPLFPESCLSTPSTTPSIRLSRASPEPSISSDTSDWYPSPSPSFSVHSLPSSASSPPASPSSSFKRKRSESMEPIVPPSPSPSIAPHSPSPRAESPLCVDRPTSGIRLNRRARSSSPCTVPRAQGHLRHHSLTTVAAPHGSFTLRNATFDKNVAFQSSRETVEMSESSHSFPSTSELLRGSSQEPPFKRPRSCSVSALISTSARHHPGLNSPDNVASGSGLPSGPPSPRARALSVYGTSRGGEASRSIREARRASNPYPTTSNYGSPTYPTSKLATHSRTFDETRGSSSDELESREASPPPLSTSWRSLSRDSDVRSMHIHYLAGPPRSPSTGTSPERVRRKASPRVAPCDSMGTKSRPQRSCVEVAPLAPPPPPFAPPAVQRRRSSSSMESDYEDELDESDSDDEEFNPRVVEPPSKRKSKATAPKAPSPKTSRKRPSKATAGSTGPVPGGVVLDDVAGLPREFRQVGSENIDKASERRRKSERKFFCEYSTCDKVFTSKQNMQIHMMKHTCVAPYACSCAYASASRSDLKRHLLSQKSRDNNCRALNLDDRNALSRALSDLPKLASKAKKARKTRN